MSNEHETTRRTKLWWWAGGVAALVVVGLVIGGLIYVRGKRIWTDGMDLNVTHSQGKVREILWTPPEPMPDQFNTPGEEYEVCLSPDDSEMYFVRGLPGKGADLFVSVRLDGKWGAPRPVASINTSYDELGPRLSRDGQTLLFYSNRPGGLGGHDIWAAVRGPDGWQAAVNLGPSVNGPHNEYSPAMDATGRRLFFSTNREAAERAGGARRWQATIRQGEIGDYDLYMAVLDAAPARRPAQRPVPPTSSPVTTPDPVEAPATRPAAAAPLPFLAQQARKVPHVNTPQHEGTPCISPAGDFLYFASNRGGGAGGFDLYRVRITGADWADVENLGPEVNTDANETDPQLAAGGFRMYFSSDRQGEGGTYDLYMTTSREVYTDREGRPLPALGWSVWVFLGALALLVPLLLFLKAGGYKHLSTLQKCAVASLLLHILMTLLFSARYMSQKIIAYVEADGGMAEVDLTVSDRLQIVSDIRSQVSKLPTEDVAPAKIERTETDLPPLDQVTLPPVDMPKNRTTPTSRMESFAVETPRPEALDDALTEPELTLSAQAPELTMAFAPQPVARDEPEPEAPAMQVGPVVTRQVTQPVVNSGAELTRADSGAPTPPQRSVVRMPDAAVPLGRPAPDAPAPEAKFLELPLDPAAPAIDMAHARADHSEQAMPLHVGTPVMATRRQATTMPAVRAQAVASQRLQSAPATRSAARMAQAGRPIAKTAPETAAPDVQPVMLAFVLAAPEPSRAPVKARAAAADAVPLARPGDVVRRTTGMPAGGQADRVARAAAAARGVVRSHAAPAARARTLARPAPLDVATDIQAALDGPQLAISPPVARPGRAAEEAAPPGSAVDPTRAATTARARTAASADKAATVVRLAMLTAPSPHRRSSRIGPADAAGLARSAPRIGGDDVMDLPTPLLPEQIPPSALAAPDLLSNRSALKRPDVVKRMGGTTASESAVGRALRYLANTQQIDGRWTTVTDHRVRRRRGKGQSDIALTGLAVLCNLAGGYTPASPSDYSKTVERGLNYLISRQRSDGSLWESGGRMYGHAIATLALAEAAAMTGDEKCRRAALKGATYILKAQHRNGGGWRYSPGERGDTSIFGWCIMALHSAKRVGLKIPKETEDEAMKYLNRVGGGRTRILAGYQDRGPSPAMSAEAAFSRMLLGQVLTDAQRSELTKYLLREGRQKDNYYCWYYTSMTMLQMGGKPWDTWNPTMRDHLVKTQRRGGTDDGSWPANGKYAGHNGGGKIYTTAMATLTLEVYYRYLPMFGGKEGNVGQLP